MADPEALSNGSGASPTLGTQELELSVVAPDNRNGVKVLATGIAGLDDILGGGVSHNHLYLIEGDPGTGKTTIALQFLLEGARLGEKCLYVALSESKTELLEIAESHGWSLESVNIFELSADVDEL